MILFPAIDLKDNQCVRLIQGDFNQVTSYSNAPVKTAKDWQRQGAKYLHLVDLNGADSGEMINFRTIQTILNQTSLPLQVGGGIRDIKRIETLLSLGVNRVILGSVAIEKPNLLKSLVDQYQDRIVVSIDAKDGRVATQGWKVISDVNAIDFCHYLESIGVSTIVYTDIAKDGMLSGPNFDIYQQLANQTKLNIIASGGVSSIDDLIKLNQMGLYGAIIGKALYENKVKLKEAILCLQNG